MVSKLKKLAKFAIPLLLFLTIYYSYSRIKINKIECRSQFGKCRQSIVSSLNRYKGSYFIIAKKESRQYLENELWVRSYQINYQLPNTLKIDVIERKVKYAIKGVDDKIFLINKEGLILSKVDDTNLPVLTVSYMDGDLGSRTEDSLLFSVDLVSTLASDFDLQNAMIKDNKMTVEIKDYPNVIFPLKGDRKLLLGSFYLISGKLRSNEGEGQLGVEKIHTIDLRYKNPVLM